MEAKDVVGTYVRVYAGQFLTDQYGVLDDTLETFSAIAAATVPEACSMQQSEFCRTLLVRFMYIVCHSTSFDCSAVQRRRP